MKKNGTSDAPNEEEIEELSEEIVYQSDEGPDYDPYEDSGYQSEQPDEVLNEQTDHNGTEGSGKRRRSSRWDSQPECSKKKKSRWGVDNPEKLNKRLYIPVKKYPWYDFIGQIAGRQGHILKKMMEESGAKLTIRGKSVRKATQKTYNGDAYVLIEADNQKSFDDAVGMMERLLIQLIERARLERSLKGHMGTTSLPTVSPLSTPTMVDDSKLYVRCLPNTTDDGCLGEIFAPFGRVIQAKVMKNRKTGESKGFGFVKYENLTSAAMAVVGMNGFMIDGRTLEVLKSADKEPKSTPDGLMSWPGPPGSMLESSTSNNFLLPRSSSVFSSTGCSSPLSLENFPGNPDYRSSQFLSYVMPPEVLPSQSQQSSRVSPFSWTPIAPPGNDAFRYS